ncbi:MAG TPA: TetR family transcriptional regulator, partial [Candidatus Angelobacter sp.]|nr:TetR family transcriptional regulator [Candidatus Angelobacter sp.]
MTTATKIRTTPRAQDTRRRIYDVALELFREKGFEQTTMRDIAAKADVALGAAYYYFASKEAIVLAFYDEMQQSSHEAILEAMRGESKLKERLKSVLEKRLELLAPNRKFCDALFRHAPDSKDPLSPFSAETRAIREGAIEHLRVAVEGSDTKVSPDLKIKLPYLLWLYQMGVILFWI